MKTFLPCQTAALRLEGMFLASLLTLPMVAQAGVRPHLEVISEDVDILVRHVTRVGPMGGVFATPADRKAYYNAPADRTYGRSHTMYVVVSSKSASNGPPFSVSWAKSEKVILKPIPNGALFESTFDLLQKIAQFATQPPDTSVDRPKHTKSKAAKPQASEADDIKAKADREALVDQKRLRMEEARKTKAEAADLAKQLNQHRNMLLQWHPYKQMREARKADTIELEGQTCVIEHSLGMWLQEIERILEYGPRRQRTGVKPTATRRRSGSDAVVVIPGDSISTDVKVAVHILQDLSKTDDWAIRVRPPATVPVTLFCGETPLDTKTLPESTVRTVRINY